MKMLLAALVAIVLAGSSACVTMEDCCECLAQAAVLDCLSTMPYDDCVQGCFQLCEPTRACYCSDARQVGCEQECGCAM